jgi:hypothetical protein
VAGFLLDDPMTATAKINLTIQKGASFSKVLRYGQPVRAYRPISAATKAAPCVLTVTAHGVPAGWPFWIESSKGMLDLNRPVLNDAGKPNAPYSAKVVDADHIELNDVNALEFNPYTGGGVLIFNTPVDLTGLTARMQVRKSVTDNAVLQALSTITGEITIDVSANTITLELPPATTTAIAWTEGVFDLEVVSPSGDVTRLASGKVTVSPEVTR